MAVYGSKRLINCTYQIDSLISSLCGQFLLFLTETNKKIPLTCSSLSPLRRPQFNLWDKTTHTSWLSFLFLLWKLRPPSKVQNGVSFCELSALSPKASVSCASLMNWEFSCSPTRLFPKRPWLWSFYFSFSAVVRVAFNKQNRVFNSIPVI